MDKKDARKQYKMKPRDMGIYQVKNLASGKIFIGRALDLNGGLNSARFQLKNGMHMNRDLQRDFSEQGEANFAFEVVDRLAAKDEPSVDCSQELKTLEEIWLKKLQPYAGKGYNRPKA